MPKGGKRPGAGRPKGAKGEAARTKDAMREHVRQRVAAELDPMVDAQIKHAKGISYLVVRAKQGGKFLRVGEAMARIKVAEGEEIIEVWEKDPSVQAFTDLLNRAIDKPKEQEQEVDLKAEIVIRWE